MILQFRPACASALTLAVGLTAVGGSGAVAQTATGLETEFTAIEIAPEGAVVDEVVIAETAPASGTEPAAQFTIGAGAAYGPDYFGAEDYSFSPTGVLRFDYIRLPGGFEFGSSGAVGYLQGFGPRGSARYIRERDASDYAEIDGLDDVDAALELGLGLGYDATYWRAFADMRYGVIGHHAWVGEFGADAILRPNDAWVVNFGPRASWGAGPFMDTYFGINPSESRKSGLDTFDPSAGFYGVGVELGARYSFSESWGVEGKAGYERLINDAADSPITEAGATNQFGLQVLITRSLSLGF